MLGARDIRVKHVTEMVNGIRTIKAGALHREFAQVMAQSRDDEVGALRGIKMLQVSFHIIAILKAVLVWLGTFMAYMLLPSRWVCGASDSYEWCALDTPTVISVMAYVRIMHQVLLGLPLLFGEIASVRASLRRIASFLVSEDAPNLLGCNALYTADEVRMAAQSGQDPWTRISAANSEAAFQAADVAVTKGAEIGQVTTGCVPSHSVQQTSSVVFDLRGASFSFLPLRTCMGSQDGTDQSHVVLRNITVTITSGSSIAVFGASGSGKSAFLLALLRELPVVAGSMHSNLSWYSWASQTPELITGSVRENILFDSPFNATRYQEVLEACALVHDLKALKHGDSTIVGHKGQRLSGGQKQR